MNIWVTTEIYNHAEQKLLIQPTPSFDGIEIYIQEVGENLIVVEHFILIKKNFL
jgi:hypothetical protein